MENEAKNSNIYKRLQELRVDFAYSKNLFFAAAERVKAKEMNLESKRNNLEIISVVISVATLSSVAFYFSQIAIGALSLFGIGISVYLLKAKNKDLWHEYVKAANGYLNLYKKAKNIEAQVEDNIIGVSEISRKVDELTDLQCKLTDFKLATTGKDYRIAKSNIDEGASAYTEDDFKNT